MMPAKTIIERLEFTGQAAHVGLALLLGAVVLMVLTVAWGAIDGWLHWRRLDRARGGGGATGGPAG